MLANCAKMHIPPSEARRLTWWEYSALLWEHQPDDTQDEVEAPDAAVVERRRQRLIDKGLMRALPDG